jgi:hypothetical protein
MICFCLFVVEIINSRFFYLRLNYFKSQSYDGFFTRILFRLFLFFYLNIFWLFLGLMVQLLHKFSIKASDSSAKLLKVIKNPITDHLPVGCRKILVTMSSQWKCRLKFLKFRKLQKISNKRVMGAVMSKRHLKLSKKFYY